MKFVLSITDSLGHNSDKDVVKVLVKHDPSESSKVSSPILTNNNNDNKVKTSGHVKHGAHSNIDQVVDNNDSSKPNGKSEEIENEESVPSPGNVEPT